MRDAHVRDAVALLEYNRNIDSESRFLSREPGEMDLTVDEERGWIDSLLKQENALILVAVHGDRVVGMLDFVGGTWSRIRHSGEFGISVAQEYWNAGIGSVLLDSLIDWAYKGGIIRKLRLRVLASNQAAIALYKKKGFEVEGLHPHEVRIGGENFSLLSMGLVLE